MQLQSFVLTTLLSSLTLTSAQSFYSFAIYTDPSCSIFVGGIDGETSQNCTALPTSGSDSSVYLQSDGFIGNCQINLYSDAYCVDQVSGTSTPPNLGCVSANGAQYYSVVGC